VTCETRRVLFVKYYEHTKKDAPDDHPKTVKCSYKVEGDEWVNRWVGPEHPEGSFFHDQFVVFWQDHMGDIPYPALAADCAEHLNKSASVPVAIDIKMQDNGFYEVERIHMNEPNQAVQQARESAADRNAREQREYEEAAEADDIPF
jgi:hypothetical protein